MAVALFAGGDIAAMGDGEEFKGQGQHLLPYEPESGGQRA
jgi:hypothetical protein